MIDVTNYISKKEKGTAEVVVAGGGFAIAFKKWDEDTGELKKPEIQAINTEELEKEKATLQQKITDIDQLIADIQVKETEYKE